MNQYSRLSQDNRCTIRHIPGYNTVCTNSALITDPYIANNSGARSDEDGVKILGNGEFTKKLDVKANAFSASAKEKIEALGGTAEVM